MLSAEGCRARQRRLLEEMLRRGWDRYITGDRFSAYYFTGSLAPPDAPIWLSIDADGRSVLVTPGSRDGVVADEALPLELYSAHRCVTHPVHDGVRLLMDRLRPASVVAIERHGTPGLVDGQADATDAVLRLRKRKEPDEADEIRAALRLCAVAYTAARESIAPGRTEIDVYNAMHAAVTRAAGGPVRFLGDFACGERGIAEGGPPTHREIRAGDLYILDLFPAPALYFGDTCRTFAVSEPTDAQRRAWTLVREATALAESMIRPGVRAADIHLAVKQFLDSHEITGRSFWHHTGHGIGHRGHEAPRMIAESDDVIEPGDVLTIEPGVYGPWFQGGVRLEDNYLVTDGGLENLFPYPLEL